MSKLIQNTIDLQTILDMINDLPEAGEDVEKVLEEIANGAY